MCTKGRSALRQKDVENNGPFLVYGASGPIGCMLEFQNANPYVAVVKDGAGVGRASFCEAQTSVLGTMQALLPNEKVTCRYLLHLVRSMRLGAGFTGSTIPHIYFKDYGTRIVPVPDIDQQGEIVSMLDRVEEQIALQDQVIIKLNELVKSRFIEMFGETPKQMVEKWGSVQLHDCVVSIDSGKSPSCKNEPRVGDGPAVLKLSALSSGTFLANENKAMQDGDMVVAGKTINRGDILVARKNTPELVGACVIVDSEPANLMFPDLVFRMHPLDCVNGNYLVTLLGKSPYSDRVRALAHGTAKSMSNIPKSELAKLPIPLPPIEVQEEFAAFVEQVDKLEFGCPMRKLGVHAFSQLRMRKSGVYNRDSWSFNERGPLYLPPS
ncbi:restriction endonuclease subunit S [Paraeggerthella hongkongensis]|nr:restriction endonuclease subunit S [Paraeggerthella hongkongensis]